MRLNKSGFLGGIAILFLGMSPGNTGHVSGQSPVGAEQALAEEHLVMAISYPEDITLGVDFAGTYRLPLAKGQAKVERKRGATKIEVELDDLKPATLFGGDFATYVLWTVSPEGQLRNTGEFVLRGDHSKLEVTTPLQTFGMLVTAEPHFLVEAPSRFIVLQNIKPEEHISDYFIRTSIIKYRGSEGIYNSSRESLAQEREAGSATRSDVRQAMIAIGLAERAGAEQYAPRELAKARESWQKTINAAEADFGDRQLMVLSHETVRQAVEAEKLARSRAYRMELAAERQARSGEIDKLEREIRQAKADAAWGRLQTQYEEFKLMMARVRAKELADARLKAEAHAAASNESAAQARSELDAARVRLKEALGKLAETRETAQGLVVNLPDIFFDFDSAALRPQAKEVLSQLCGIVSVAGDYRLNIEGYTDSVGSDGYNQKLSEDRAESVRNYLTTCGISSDLVSSEGYGESQPIASNDNADGRRKNRRVEILVQETTTVTTADGLR